jgi:hypothetical protein
MDLAEAREKLTAFDAENKYVQTLVAKFTMQLQY